MFILAIAGVIRTDQVTIQLNEQPIAFFYWLTMSKLALLIAQCKLYRRQKTLTSKFSNAHI